MKRTCRTTTYLRTPDAIMSCIVYFYVLHVYVLAVTILMYVAQKNKCNNISNCMQVLFVEHTRKVSNWGSRTVPGNASKPSKRLVPRSKVGFGALERVLYSLSVCGDSRGHIETCVQGKGKPRLEMDRYWMRSTQAKETSFTTFVYLSCEV